MCQSHKIVKLSIAGSSVLLHDFGHVSADPESEHTNTSVVQNSFDEVFKIHNKIPAVKKYLK